jgi:two-component system, NarL family, invasion response regulator UvrY
VGDDDDKGAPTGDVIMIRVVIGDDHAIVRRGVKDIIEAEADMAVIGEAANAEELVSVAQLRQPEAIVADITMPGRSGLEALKELRRCLPEVPVVILSAHAEDQYAIPALRAGAAAYVSKESAPSVLVTALRKVVDGGRYVSSRVAERLAASVAGDGEPAGPSRLSEREREVLCLLASGKSLSDVAELLSLSINTVGTYRARILEKTGLKSSAQLIRYAFDAKLIA